MNPQTPLQQALVWALPLYEMARMRAATSPLISPVHGPAPDGQRWSNVFTHARKLLNPGNSRVVTPNNDTLYTNAWLDLSDGPLVMTVPDVGDRYYVLGFLDFFTNPFAHVGTRLTGSGARSFFITGSNWQGEVPEAFRAAGAHIQSGSNWVWIIGRIYVSGKADLPAVHALQDQFDLRAADGSAAQAPKAFTPSMVMGAEMTGAEFLKQVNLALLDSPPPAAEAAALAQWAALGFGAGLQATPAQAAAVEAQLPQVKAMLLEASLSEPRPSSSTALAAASVDRTWQNMPLVQGHFGSQHQLRARVALQYIGMLETAEAMYPMARSDASGQPLHGQHRYQLRFAPDRFPPVNAFWSLTMYDSGDCMLVTNAIDRYAIGDRTQGLHMDADGGLTLHLSHQEPADATARANWLPAPAGEFYLCLRAYLPKPEMVAGRYQLPGVQRVHREAKALG